MKKLLYLLPLLLLTGCGSNAGTGGASSKYSVRLTWVAPTPGSDPAVSYNVYREMTSDNTFEKVNTSAIAGVTYTDSAVQLGASYLYVVRAVGADGQEGDASNTATVTIPSN